MKHLRFAAVILAAGAFGMLRAQDEERHAPPTEIPDFSNLDEFIYEPKSVLTLGIRHLSRARTTFSGHGLIVSTLDEPGPATGANLLRHYHDGTIQPDSRNAIRVDTSGNPIVDQSAGGQVTDPIASDGKTNTWAYSDLRQLTDNGFLVYHAYSAEVIDTNARQQNTLPNYGMDIAVSRDMGKVFGSRITWSLIAGLSLNDLSADRTENVTAKITTDSDYYNLFGQTPPPPPYSAPSSANVNILNAAGGNLVTDDGVAQTVLSDTTILLANEPAARLTTSKTDDTSVNNRWKLHGAYYTLRAGPTIMIPIFSHVHLSLSAGAALVYSGSNYSVTETFQPEIGGVITDTGTNLTYKLLPGYFADANLQVDITDRTGFYAGAVVQSAGSYVQNLDTVNAHYSTKVDLSNQNGYQAGLTYRF